VFGPYTEEDIAERQRQFRWERSEIDYLGEDSFEHIKRRLDEAIYGHWHTLPEIPSPVPSLTNLTPSSVDVFGQVYPCQAVEYRRRIEAKAGERIPTTSTTKKDVDRVSEDHRKSTTTSSDDKKRSVTTPEDERTDVSRSATDEERKEDENNRTTSEDNQQQYADSSAQTATEEEKETTKLSDEDKGQPNVAADTETERNEEKGDAQTTEESGNKADEEKTQETPGDH